MRLTRHLWQVVFHVAPGTASKQLSVVVEKTPDGGSSIRAGVRDASPIVSGRLFGCVLLCTCRVCFLFCSVSFF